MAMKNIKKKKILVDVMAEARKHPKFIEYYERAAIRNRFAVEMYRLREEKGLSQQALAKLAKTTQKVISNVEYGDVNLGMDLLNRIAQTLGFGAENWGRVFDFNVQVTQYVLKTSSNSASSKELIGNIENTFNYDLTVKQ